MKDIISEEASKSRRKWIIDLLNSYFVSPAIRGLIGFFLFLLIIIVTKYLAYLVADGRVFLIQAKDIILALFGFIAGYLIKLLTMFKK
jgi:hypothetical protein